MKFSKLPRERKGAGAGEGLTSCWTDTSCQKNKRLKEKKKKKKSCGFPERRASGAPLPDSKFLLFIKTRCQRKFHLTRHTLCNSYICFKLFTEFMLHVKTWVQNVEEAVYFVAFSFECSAVNSDWFYHSAATCCSPLAHHGNSLSHLIRYLIHNKSILISFMFGGRRGGGCTSLRGLSAVPPPSSHHP